MASQVQFPSGYYVTWRGQFENMERAIEKMKVVIPVTLLIIFLLLYSATFRGTVVESEPR